MDSLTVLIDRATGAEPHPIFIDFQIRRERGASADAVAEHDRNRAMAEHWQDSFGLVV